MPLTITEKILTSPYDRKEVKPGDLIFSKVNVVLPTDIGTASSIEIFEKMGAYRSLDHDKAVVIHWPLPFIILLALELLFVALFKPLATWLPSTMIC